MIGKVPTQPILNLQRGCFRSLLTCLVALVAWSTSPVQSAGALPLKKISIQMDWYPQAEQGGFYFAQVNGLYKAVGLDVDFIPLSPNTAGALGQITMGRIQFALSTSTDVMTARYRGLPLVSIMAYMQHDPKGIIVHADSDVHSFADLSGHSLDVFPGSAWFQYLLQKYHLTHVQETRLSLSNSSFMIDPHHIQECYVTSEPYFIEKAGVKERTLLLKDSGFDNYRTITTSESFLANNQDVVKAFVMASIAGWKGYLNNPKDAFAEIKRRNPEMTQGQMDYTFKTLIADQFITGDAAKGEAIGQINPKRIAEQCGILQSLKILPTDFDYTKSFNNEFCAPGIVHP